MSAISDDMAGKHVLITGAGSGIGRETAFAFAAAGATLHLTDIQGEHLERTALLASKLGAEVHAHRTDVADAQAMERLAEQVHQQTAALDVLINNAGVGVAGSFVGTELSVWDWALSINVKGVVHGCHYFLPPMVSRGAGGHVVNVASAAGLMAAAGMSVYCTTKFAVVGLSESLRAELRPHDITVSTICPGVIDTAIVKNTRRTGHLAQREDFNERAAAFYRKRGYGPERVARVIFEAARERKNTVIPVAPEAWAMYYGKRFMPDLVAQLPDVASTIMKRR